MGADVTHVACFQRGSIISCGNKPPPAKNKSLLSSGLFHVWRKVSTQSGPSVNTQFYAIGA